ncbi:DUF4404 family protein [Halopseudomonas nanhaiensis]|uniref:DUF4404 family protein n=1 Tax=Halopseudomonas nanhaiensis TaxID=2830842 RepID=UPI001CBDC1B9|nr:DUF4404 family protein [Halopseudomonas nanhaiensis]UAW97127.1 DUF4404 family protein [Halopseudomonas nanhaiensis]
MPANRLKVQLEHLQETLTDPEAPLTPEERQSLQELATNLEARVIAMEAQEQAEADPTLVDGVNLMVERFEASHPRVAGTLRSVMQTLVDIGV